MAKSLSSGVLLTVPSNVLSASEHPTLKRLHERAVEWRKTEQDLHSQEATDEVMTDLVRAAGEAGDKSFQRVVDAIRLTRSGDHTKKVPKFAAAVPMLTALLQERFIDGWIYKRGGDGNLLAFLVGGISIDRSNDPNNPDKMALGLLYTGGKIDRDARTRQGDDGVRHTWVSWTPAEITNKTLVEILESRGLLVETPALREEYNLSAERYREVLTTGFAKQFRFTGLVQQSDAFWDRIQELERTNVKVIDDLHPNEITVAEHGLSYLHLDEDGEPSLREIPIQPLIRVFDLSTQEFYWLLSDDLTDYKYDKSIGKKLVLPVSHRDLLNILTTDISTFTGDIIEGKSAGNVILSKGIPGIGKTLTAEVYAELIEKPLYSIHSGSLGTNAESVRKNLEQVFKRAKRWGCVLLLDEADVFVIERGANIEQNAIVAEFLRTLEYFDGLLFMTTNRADDIDEAILSRCAAIIGYTRPTRVDALKVWRIMADQFGAEMSDDLIEEVVAQFWHATPRDVKMLTRLAVRVAKAHGEPLSLELFVRCATFRGLTPQYELEA